MRKLSCRQTHYRWPVMSFDPTDKAVWVCIWIVQTSQISISKLVVKQTHRSPDSRHIMFPGWRDKQQDNSKCHCVRGRLQKHLITSESHQNKLHTTFISPLTLARLVWCRFIIKTVYFITEWEHYSWAVCIVFSELMRARRKRLVLTKADVYISVRRAVNFNVAPTIQYDSFNYLFLL